MERQYMFHIYKNLFKYLKYRNIKEPKSLTVDKFNEDMDADSMVTIYTDDIIIILTKVSGKYSTLNADGKRKIKDIALKAKAEEILYICNINYIAKKTATSLVTTQKTLLELNDAYPNIWFQIRPYLIFELNIPESLSVPKHAIIDKAEVDKLMQSEHRAKSSLPQIHEWDAPVCWLGGRAGQFVEVDRYSPMVGIQKIIRYIIK